MAAASAGSEMVMEDEDPAPTPAPDAVGEDDDAPPPIAPPAEAGTEVGAPIVCGGAGAAGDGLPLLNATPPPGSSMADGEDDRTWPDAPPCSAAFGGGAMTDAPAPLAVLFMLEATLRALDVDPARSTCDDPPLAPPPPRRFSWLDCPPIL